MAAGTIKRNPRPFWGRGVPDPNAHPASFSRRAVLIHAPAGGATYLPTNFISIHAPFGATACLFGRQLFVLRNINFLGIRLVNFSQHKQNLFIYIHTPFGATLASDSPPPTTGPCGPTDFSKINYQHIQSTIGPRKKQEENIHINKYAKWIG